MYDERDPFAEGLVYIRHTWESGLDNSPLKKDIPRRQRPSDEEYDRCVYLVDLFRRLDYDEAAIFQESPFLMQDPLFNSVLSRANEDLAELGDRLGEDTAKIREWHEQTNRTLREKLWHEEHGAFDVYDLRANVRLDILTASGFMPASESGRTHVERIGGRTG